MAGEPPAALGRGGGRVRAGDILRRRASRRLSGERPDPAAGRKLRLSCPRIVGTDAARAGAAAGQMGLSDL